MQIYEKRLTFYCSLNDKYPYKCEWQVMQPTSLPDKEVAVL